MAEKKSKKLRCPKCGKEVFAQLNHLKYKSLIFKCPDCFSNVALYGGKVGILSDQYVSKLMKKHKLDYCGFVFNFDRAPANKGVISKDDIINLKILLETESCSDKIISSL